MTAQIGIKNNNAVILATDSAVTIGDGNGNGKKIYNGVNKLFALSKTEPIGIMIYSSATILGVSWETIIKMYRKDHLKDTSFDYLKDYVDNFTKWLEENSELFFDLEKQKIFFSYLIHTFIKGEYIDKFYNYSNNIFDKGDETKKKDLINKMFEIIDENYEILGNKEELNKNSFKFNKNFKEDFGKIITEYFYKFNLNEIYKNKIIESCFLGLLSKDFFTNYTGIVISGFGKKDIEPNIIELKISTILYNTLRYNYIDHKNEDIVPFAQREDVDNFLKGIHPISYNYFEDILNRYPKVITDSIKGLENKEKDDLLKRIKKVNNKLLKEYNEKITRETFILPTLKMINSMPIDEMCHLAESLINLTSLRKKISSGLETVGGETEVVSISKGDGFIWIKRKHYFKAELNPGFMKNYLNS